ncbi:hypothetical protein EV644_11211 [Kribbella orskensis]|uniref:Uncharacterized protein n=1 Tax=Kribbella orskensis TaxID=2512216 RepID=A0ABY2BGV3_9ACTN|nr:MULTISPECIES: hypothetical protein [Kribbella]TCN36847.1 hypothetical protein EV642_11311 [Kribbella sp. VKM Ac-2500]TCO18271.1 hypothetical protein EV644_11211 [Kribbella orskensis]
MTIKVRLSGEADEIARLVEHLRREFEVAGADRAYPNRGSFGVRVYLELRQPTAGRDSRRIRSEHVHPDRRGIEP